MSEPARAAQEGVGTVEPALSTRKVGHFAVLSLLESVRSLAFLLVIAIFVITFISQPFRIPSASMERTLLVGDFLLVNKAAYGPAGDFGWLLPYQKVKPGDIVVFYFPLNPSEHVVKRVIGVPGDRIHLINGVVYRNGQALNASYVLRVPAWPDSFRDNFPTDTYTDPGVDVHWWEQMRKYESGSDLVVPAGEYFVLGDNRNDSRDSRYWGFVPVGNIVGRPFIIYFSVREPPGQLPELPPQGGPVAQRPAGSRVAGQQNDRLEHEGPLDRIVDFARWTRILRVVR
ncbi:MAG: signal peptidase I [Acidobacteriaceae bacterium]